MTQAHTTQKSLNFFKSLNLFKKIGLVLFLYLLGSGQVIYAAIPDAATMMANLAEAIPQLMKLVTATAYVMGMFFIYKGIYSLKEFGEARTQMSSHHSLKGPLILLTVGTALLYLPSSVQVGLATFWTYTSPIGYVVNESDQWETMYDNAYLIIQLIGTISFIRGLLIFTRLSGHSGQPGEFGRGLTHIIAGIMCINLYGFLEMINGTLGITGVIK